MAANSTDRPRKRLRRCVGQAFEPDRTAWVINVSLQSLTYFLPRFKLA